MRYSVFSLAILSLLAPITSAQWIPVPNPPDSFQGIELFYAGDDRLYAGSFNGKVFASTNHGSSWTEIADGLPVDDYAVVSSMVTVGDWFIMSRVALMEPESRNFRSRRSGNAWSTWEHLDHQVEVFHSFSVIGETLFAVGDVSGIVRTDDFGATWSPVTAPSANPTGKVFAREGRLFAAEQISNGGMVHRSDDLGATWTEIGGELGSSEISSEIYWKGRLLLYVGAGSLWSSVDFGESWEEITTIPTSSTINGMAIARDGRLAIGAASGFPVNASIWLTNDLVDWDDFTGDLDRLNWSFRSLVAHDGWFFKTGATPTEYRAPQPGVTAVDDIPDATALMLKAHPNPFNPNTTLSFVLDEASHVELSVYDVSGRHVATIARGLIPAGVQELLWDARDDFGRPLASGVYLVRLRTPRAEQSLRTVLLK